MKENKTKQSNKKKTAKKNKATNVQITNNQNNKANKKEQIKEVIKVEKVKVEERKSEHANNELAPVTSNEMTKLAKLVLIVTSVFLIFYGITILVVNNKKDDTESGNVNIQYDEILLGNVFDQPSSEYYVLVTKEDDDYATAYSMYVSKYSTKENAIRVYTANLDSGFNNYYEAEESNTNTNNIENLKLNGSTLLKISNKKIVAAYEGSTKIIEHLQSILK